MSYGTFVILYVVREQPYRKKVLNMEPFVQPSGKQPDNQYGSASYPGNNEEKYDVDNDDNQGTYQIVNTNDINSGTPVSILSAIQFGFTRTFKNAGFWIVYSLITVAVLGIGMSIFFSPLLIEIANDPYASQTDITFGAGSFLAYIIMMIAITALGIVGMVQAIQEVRVVKPDYTTVVDGGKLPKWSTALQNIKWGKIILTMIIIVVLSGLIIGTFSSLTMLMLLGSMQSESASAGIAIVLSLLIIAAYVAFLVAMMFVSYAVYFAEDNYINDHLSPLDCIKLSWNAVKPQFWKVLGFAVLISIITYIGAIFTLGIGIIILTPASVLAQAHIYRQLSGQYVPIKQ